MNVKAIKTAQTEAAVNRIKKMTKREVKDVCHEVPELFIEKRNYMQSDEFLKDEHNKKMLDLGEDLYNCRIQISNEIKKINKNINNKFVQAINGFTRLKSDIDKESKINFEEIPTFDTQTENKYRVIRNIEIFLESENARSELNTLI